MIISILTECPTAYPAAPEGATASSDGSTAAGTVVTYTCSNGGKVYAVVSIGNFKRI